MKKIVSLFVLAAMLCVAALPIFAEEISFTVFDATEADYVYAESGTSVSVGDRVHDSGSYVIYEFPLEEGATVAQLALHVSQQYVISVTTTDPDDPYAYTVVAQAEPTEEEKAAGAPNWGAINPVEYITVLDLSEYCVDNEEGLIWVKIADAEPGNGWGARVQKTSPVRFYSGKGPAPEIEQPLTMAELAEQMLNDYEYAEGTQYFVINHESEEPYIYFMGGAVDHLYCRYFDQYTYAIYAFDVKAADTEAWIHLSVNMQYDIRATMGDPDDIDSYVQIATAFPTDDEIESGIPNWGSRYTYEEIVDPATGEVLGKNQIIPVYDFDLSEVLTGKDGKLYVYIGDCSPINGWGPYISIYEPVVFSTSGDFYTKLAVEEPETTPETTPETEPETVPETEPETEPETVAETEPETVAETVAETEPETVAETVAETEPETEAETVEETEAETEEETEAETEEETEEETEADTEAETEPETEADTEAETEPETEPETTPVADEEEEGTNNTAVIIAVVAAVVVVAGAAAGIVIAKKKK